MSPFFGTNPILVKWSWLGPRILVLAVQARGRASSQPRNAASTRGLRCPHRTCYCADASPDARWFAGMCLHSLPLATAPRPHNDRVAVANMSSSACPSAWAGTVPSCSRCPPTGSGFSVPYPIRDQVRRPVGSRTPGPSNAGTQTNRRLDRALQPAFDSIFRTKKRGT
jgi:hypothetical protein